MRTRLWLGLAGLAAMLGLLAAVALLAPIAPDQLLAARWGAAGLLAFAAAASGLFALALDRHLSRRKPEAEPTTDNELEPASAETRLAARLDNALTEQQFQLYYQPKMRARTGVIEGAEALIRWDDPDGGLIGPDSFVPVAEASGQIRAMTEWTLARAVADQRELAARGVALPLYVNISARLIGDGAFTESLLALTADRVGTIGIEITETATIDDRERGLQHLRRFAEAGLRIAIDDYGVGMSSLSYLKQLPAHELKIDRAFVSSLTRSHRDPLLVRSTIDLAHALGLEVTAEGVENPATLALLKVMGCDIIQGFLIARPMPLDALIEFMAAQPASGEQDLALRRAQ